MKLRWASSSCRARTCILPTVLAVLGLAPAHPCIAVPQVTDSSGQSYYEDATPLLDYPLPDLLKAVPELQGLEPEESQEALASILDKVGHVSQDLMENMPNLVSREMVTQEKPRAKGKGAEQRRVGFDYMVLVHRHGGGASLDEYRAGPGGTPRVVHGFEQGYMLTEGFASQWLHFHPANQLASEFRYLGRQSSGGLRSYVVAFAQIPGSAAVTSTMFSEGKLASNLYQGIAWIDEASFRIVRLRTDLLAPRPDLGLERLTTELRFGEVRLAQTASPLWLPKEVVVTADSEKRHFRNVHRFTDYRLFKVETKIGPAPPDQTPN